MEYQQTSNRQSYKNKQNQNDNVPFYVNWFNNQSDNHSPKRIGTAPLIDRKTSKQRHQQNTDTKYKQSPYYQPYQKDKIQNPYSKKQQLQQEIYGNQSLYQSGMKNNIYQISKIYSNNMGAYTTTNKSYNNKNNNANNKSTNNYEPPMTSSYSTRKSLQTRNLQNDKDARPQTSQQQRRTLGNNANTGKTGQFLKTTQDGFFQNNRNKNNNNNNQLSPRSYNMKQSSQQQSNNNSQQLLKKSLNSSQNTQNIIRRNSNTNNNKSPSQRNQQSPRSPHQKPLQQQLQQQQQQQQQILQSSQIPQKQQKQQQQQNSLLKQNKNSLYNSNKNQQQQSQQQQQQQEKQNDHQYEYEDQDQDLYPLRKSQYNNSNNQQQFSKDNGNQPPFQKEQQNKQQQQQQQQQQQLQENNFFTNFSHEQPSFDKKNSIQKNNNNSIQNNDSIITQQQKQNQSQQQQKQQQLQEQQQQSRSSFNSNNNNKNISKQANQSPRFSDSLSIQQINNNNNNDSSNKEDDSNDEEDEEYEYDNNEYKNNNKNWHQKINQKEEPHHQKKIFKKTSYDEDLINNCPQQQSQYATSSSYEEDFENQQQQQQQDIYEQQQLENQQQYEQHQQQQDNNQFIIDLDSDDQQTESIQINEDTAKIFEQINANRPGTSDLRKGKRRNTRNAIPGQGQPNTMNRSSVQQQHQQELYQQKQQQQPIKEEFDNVGVIECEPPQHMKRQVYENGGYVLADQSVIPNSKRPPSRHKVPPKAVGLGLPQGEQVKNIQVKNMYGHIKAPVKNNFSKTAQNFKPEQEQYDFIRVDNNNNNKELEEQQQIKQKNYFKVVDYDEDNEDDDDEDDEDIQNFENSQIQMQNNFLSNFQQTQPINSPKTQSYSQTKKLQHKHIQMGQSNPNSKKKRLEGSDIVIKHNTSSNISKKAQKDLKVPFQTSLGNDFLSLFATIPNQKNSNKI